MHGRGRSTTKTAVEHLRGCGVPSQTELCCRARLGLLFVCRRPLFRCMAFAYVCRRRSSRRRVGMYSSCRSCRGELSDFAAVPRPRHSVVSLDADARTPRGRVRRLRARRCRPPRHRGLQAERGLPRSVGTRFTAPSSSRGARTCATPCSTAGSTRRWRRRRPCSRPAT